MLRLALFFNNHDTLGHATKSLLLVKALKETFKDKIKILVFENGIRQLRFFPFSRYASLCFVPSINDPCAGLSYGNKKILKGNFHLLKESLDRLKPHIFITEYFPFTDNLNFIFFRQLLEHLKSTHKTKILASFTHLNNTENLRRLIVTYYDLLLYHYPEELSRGYEFYLPLGGSKAIAGILSECRKKVIYTGFIMDEAYPLLPTRRQIAEDLGLKKRKLILVSRGGRDELKKMMLVSFLSARRHKDWFFLLSAGPFCKDREFSNYLKMAGKLDNVCIKKIIYPYFENYLRSADLSINMAGYSTMVRLLRFNKKSLTCPAQDAEQRWNAKLLSDLTTCETIVQKNFKYPDFERKIHQLLESRPENMVENMWFYGLRRTVNVIKHLN